MSNSGTVKRFDRKRGFGFIKPKGGGKELFVHWSDITSEDKWPSLKMNQEVKYDTKKSEKRDDDVACNVSDASGAAISLGEATEHKLSTFTAKGVVKYFAKRGFGFIESTTKITWPKKCPVGTDIYVSRESLVCVEGSVCTLRSGTEVAFKVFKREGQESLAAAEVTQADGSPLNFEPREPGEKGEKKKKFKGKKKGKGKGKGGGKVKVKGGGKGVKKTISKLAKSQKTKVYEKPEGKIVKMGKGGSKGSSKGSKGNKIVKMGKGGSKGKGGFKGVKKTIQKIVYMPVPVHQKKFVKGGKGGGGKGAKPAKGGKGGGGKASKGGGKGKGTWKLVPKSKTKQEFW